MADEDYRGQHKAPGPASGMPLHDTTDVYPKDFYGPNGFRYYADQGSDYDRNSYNTAVRLNGKPEEPVLIHRAVPLDVYKKAMKTDAPLSHLIKKGDWVTPSKEYAREHGEGLFGGKYKVVGKRVRAKDVFTNGDSIHEWGYHPAEKAEGGEVDEPGITAYHGSPHDFEQFDMSKIGTGEGAQAYGHGLYFAQNPSVAKSYRPVSSENKPVPIIIDGQKFENPTAMQKLVAQHQGNVDAVHKAMSPHWERAASEFQSAPQDPDDLGYMLAENDHQQALAQKAELEALRGKKIEHDYSGHHEGHALAGHSYEVRINAHPDHFFDWDKPLNEQSEYVQNALAGLHKSGKYVARPQGSPYRPSFEDNPRGRQFLAGLRDALGGSKKEASQNLYAAGIKGVKYLDQGSVNATHKGTRNYVVFDDKLVNVKRKYEKGGIVQGEAPIHALHLTSKFGNSLPSAVNQAKAATRRRPLTS